jgi:hypothetical protein
MKEFGHSVCLTGHVVSSRTCFSSIRSSDVGSEGLYLSKRTTFSGVLRTFAQGFQIQRCAKLSSVRLMSVLETGGHASAGSRVSVSNAVLLDLLA